MTEIRQVPLKGTAHRVRPDNGSHGGSTPQQPLAELPRASPGYDESTWPETWEAIPPRCPVCESPTIADPYHNSRAGPGWRCSHDSIHFWQVRTAPLRLYLASNPSQRSCYPWYDATEEDRQAWLEAHCHLPRVTPTESEGETEHALD